jgi:hypothetical protein
MCGDRPALDIDEIEITPEMVKAGAREVLLYDSRFEGPEDLAIRVFEVMTEARPVPNRG